MTGLSKTYLVRLETQPSNPSIQVLGRIAEALDLTVADLLGSPRVEIEDDALNVPPSLRAFLDEEGLGTPARRTLASIKFRRGEHPTSVDRWRYIWNSLELSRSLDHRDDDDD